MSAGLIIWAAFVFGAVIGGLVGVAVMAFLVASRETEEATFTPEDMARLLERAK